MRERKYKSQKLKFHPTYYILALGFILSGYYLNFITFTTLIIIHEFGHVLAAILCKVKVKQIIIYPYGGKTIIETYLNRCIHQEIFIASFGVITQFFFYLILNKLYQFCLIREYTMNLFTLYNSQIIFFNLLPIYPLDGGKILSSCLNLFIPYQQANHLTILISLLNIFSISIMHIYKYNYSNIMIFLLLAYYLYQFYQKRKILYHKFLLERYLYQIKFPKIKIVKDIHHFYLNKSHILKKEDKFLEERKVLNDFFNYDVKLSKDIDK